MNYTSLQIIEAVAGHKDLQSAATSLGFSSHSSVRKILVNEPAVAQFHRPGGRWATACRRYLEKFCGPQDNNYDPAIEFDLEDEFRRL